MPPNTMLVVLIPRGAVQAMGALLVQEHDTYTVPASALTTPAATPRASTAASTLNLRAAPERGAALVGQVQVGAALTVTGAAVGEYAPVTIAGWVLVSGVNGA